MARNKEQVSKEIKAKEAGKAPSKAPRAAAKQAKDAVAEVPSSAVQEFTQEPLSAVPPNPVEPGVGGPAESLYEQRQKEVANLVGGAVDINAVLAQHLASSGQVSAGSDKVAVSRSSVVRPVKLVHCIASEMYEQNPDMKRKDVIAACEAVGIATHTARTQYQIWAQAMRNDHAPKPTVPASMAGTDHALPRGGKGR